MNCIDIINKTKRSQKLTNEEIKYLINGYTSGEIPDYQMSAWLMAVCLNGISEEETITLTKVMRDSGDVLDLSCIGGFTADKHSTGGVGDKTSLIIGPVVASCGVYMPKMSGRGLGHTGGTIDKLESIEGYRVELPFEQFAWTVKKTGFSIISQSGNLCPADKKIYALRNATGTVDSIPLICASIMSKKLAMNTDCILLDVKYGSGAFMKTYEEACVLAELMEKVGTASGKKCRAMVTDMNTPLGNNVGNALEVIEAIEILRNERKGALYELCIDLSANILELAGKGDIEQCREMARDAISSGKALEVFRKTVELHGGNPAITEDTSILPQAKYSFKVKAVGNAVIKSINSEEIGMTSLLLGAGRTEKDGQIDMSAGIVMECSVGDTVYEGDTLMTLYSSVCSDFSQIAVRAVNAVEFQ